MEHHFDIDIAKEYGIAEAVLINHFQFWIAKNKANGKNINDGHCWTYNSNKALLELFPYLSEQNLRTALKHLINAGVLLKGNYNVSPHDRTLWYAFVDENKWIRHFQQMDLLESTNGFVRTNEPIPYNNTDNNTSKTNNNIQLLSKEDITSKETSKEKRFVKPTLEQVAAYIAERNSDVNPQRFLDYYESNGWMVGRTHMKDWKAAVRTWEAKEVKSSKRINYGNIDRNDGAASPAPRKRDYNI